MMIAGLWDRYRDASGSWQESYTMLTINADQHPLLRDYHRPGDEKRMVVVLPEAAYEEWLEAPVDAVGILIRPFQSERLIASTGVEG